MSFDTHEEVLKIYTDKLNLKTAELNEVEMFQIIKQAYLDFKQEKLPFDDFSTLGETLFSRLEGMSKSLHFGSILLEIAELSDFIRFNEINNKFINLTSALIRIDEYFKSFENK